MPRRARVGEVGKGVLLGRPQWRRVFIRTRARSAQ